MARSSWQAGALAAVMIMIAVYCAGRLAISLLRRRETELDADGLHLVMGVAMAGMFLPRLSPLPDRAWEAIFGIGAAWFAWQSIRTRRSNGRTGWRSPHPLPHLVECIAMLYMLLALAGPRPAGPAAGMPMPGMGASPGAAGSLPALAVVLALFMVGHVVWTADQFASLARGRTAVAARGASRVVATRGAPGAGSIEPRATAGRAILAPRLAACYKIAMSITMGYTLILMI